jgi:flagellar biosynthesis protein FlhB
MLGKLLLTGIIVLMVLVYFRLKLLGKASSHASDSVRNAASKHNNNASIRSLSVKTLVNIVLVALIVISVALFINNKMQGDRRLSLIVISPDGVETHYQTRERLLSGRRFITLDGREVSLSQGDRIERKIIE